MTAMKEMCKRKKERDEEGEIKARMNEEKQIDK
jgi:hypothetical protein